MKKSIFLLHLMVNSAVMFGQSASECTGIIGNLPTSQVKSAYVYDPNINMRYIKVNIHYMLKSDGTGNFTETPDGVVNSNSPYNGYSYAELLIYWANQRIAANPKMNLPPGNTTPNYDIKYRFILSGVYFHRNSSYYYFPQDGNGILNTYGVNLGSEINIFLENANSTSNGGHANMFGPRFIEIKGVWDMYNQYYYVDKLISTWAFAGTICHESGHNFGLNHPMRYPYGPCCPTTPSSCGDDCSDTPSRDQMWALGIDACCASGVVSAYCDNNLMNYSGEQALTPCQLSIVFDNFEKAANLDGLRPYLACKFDNNIFDLCALGSTQFYIAKTINFPSSGCNNGVIPANQRVTFVAKDGIFLNCGFEVPLGSMFEGYLLTSCE